jgi:hypothetical protein
LEQLSICYPQAFQQLPDFVDHSLALYDDESLIPDTVGASNLVVNIQTGNFLVIDGQPLTEVNLQGQVLSLDRLRNLEAALA